jgi:transcription elongation GreA/GreB family factor
VNAAPAVDELLVTAEGYERLCSELQSLRSEGRRAMSERLREARTDGGSSRAGTRSIAVATRLVVPS